MPVSIETGFRKGWEAGVAEKKPFLFFRSGAFKAGFHAFQTCNYYHDLRAAPGSCLRYERDRQFTRYLLGDMCFYKDGSLEAVAPDHLSKYRRRSRRDYHEPTPS